MVVVLNLAKVPTSSRLASCWLFHNSLLTSEASKARRIPDAVPVLASPLYGHKAHTMPLPAARPLAESASIPPGKPFGGMVNVLCDAGVVWKIPPDSLNALRPSLE